MSIRNMHRVLQSAVGAVTSRILREQRGLPAWGQHSTFESLERRQYLTGDGPSITGVTWDFETLPHKLIVSFDRDVSASLDPSDLYLISPVSGTVRPAGSVAWDSGTSTATWSVGSPAGGLLQNGWWQAIFLAHAITDSAGNPLESEFHDVRRFVRYDVSHDGLIDSLDSWIVEQHLNAPGTYSQGDVTYDGYVDETDLMYVDIFLDSAPLLPPLQAPPSSITALAAGQDVIVAWDPTGSEGKALQIQGSNDGLSFVTLSSTVAADNGEFLDTTGYQFYRMRAVAGGTSRMSYVVPVTTSAPPAPTGLTNSVMPANQIRLDWTNPETYDAVEVWQSANAGTWQRIGQVGSDVDTYVVRDLAAATTYTWKLRVRQNGVFSPFSGVTSHTAGRALIAASEWQWRYQIGPQSIAAVYNVDNGGTSVKGGAGSTITLSDVTATNLTTGTPIDSDNMALGALEASGHFPISFQGTLGAGLPNGVLPSGNYEWMFRADGVDSSGQLIPRDYVHPFWFLRGDINRDRVVDGADVSLLVGYLTGAPTNGRIGHDAGDVNFDGSTNNLDIAPLVASYGVRLPLPPSGANELTATAATDDPSSQIALQWTPPPVDGIDGFGIWRSEDGQNFYLHHFVDDPNARAWVDLNLREGHKYTYRIRAHSDAGYSTVSNRAWAVTPLRAPSDVEVSAISGPRVSVRWRDNSQNESSYTVRVGRVLASGSVEYDDITGVPALDGTGFKGYTVEGLDPFAVYVIGVKAVNAVTETPFVFAEGEPTGGGMSDQRTAWVSGEPIAVDGEEYHLHLDAHGEVPEAWTIDWGDGHTETITGSPSSVSHAFLSTSPSGSRVIEAVAHFTDASLPANLVTVSLTAADITAAAEGDSRVEVGTPFQLRLRASSIRPEIISSWAVDWGDGSSIEHHNFDQHADSMELTHTFTEEGTAAISVSAVDVYGRDFPAHPVQVTVFEVPQIPAAPALTVGRRVGGEIWLEWESAGIADEWILQRTVNSRFETLAVLPSTVREWRIPNADAAATVYRVLGRIGDHTSDPDAVSSRHYVPQVIGVPEDLQFDAATGLVWWIDRSDTDLGHVAQFPIPETLNVFNIPAAAAGSMVTFDVNQLLIPIENIEVTIATQRPPYPADAWFGLDDPTITVTTTETIQPEVTATWEIRGIGRVRFNGVGRPLTEYTLGVNENTLVYLKTDLNGEFETTVSTKELVREVGWWYSNQEFDVSLTTTWPGLLGATATLSVPAVLPPENFRLGALSGDRWVTIEFDDPNRGVVWESAPQDEGVQIWAWEFTTSPAPNTAPGRDIWYTPISAERVILYDMQPGEHTLTRVEVYPFGPVAYLSPGLDFTVSSGGAAIQPVTTPSMEVSVRQQADTHDVIELLLKDWGNYNVHQAGYYGQTAHLQIIDHSGEATLFPEYANPVPINESFLELAYNRCRTELQPSSRNIEIRFWQHLSESEANQPASTPAPSIVTHLTLQFEECPLPQPIPTSRFVPVDDEDRNDDGVADFAEAQPVTFVRLPYDVIVQPGASVSFDYDYSPLSNVETIDATTLSPRVDAVSGDGGLRLWQSGGAGQVVAPGVTVPFQPIAIQAIRAGEYTVTMTIDPDGSGPKPAITRTVEVVAVDADLVWDGRDGADPRDEVIERTPWFDSPTLFVADGDADRDGIADLADGLNLDSTRTDDDDSPGTTSVPLTLRLPGSPTLNDAAVRITYQAATPDGAGLSLLPDGTAHVLQPGLRLWAGGRDPNPVVPVLDGEPGSFVAPGIYQAADLARLGFVDGVAVLQVEAVTAGSYTITVEIDPDGLVGQDSGFLPGETFNLRALQPTAPGADPLVASYIQGTLPYMSSDISVPQISVTRNWQLPSELAGPELLGPKQSVAEWHRLVRSGTSMAAIVDGQPRYFDRHGTAWRSRFGTTEQLIETGESETPFIYLSPQGRAVTFRGFDSAMPAEHGLFIRDVAPGGAALRLNTDSLGRPELLFEEDGNRWVEYRYFTAGDSSGRLQSAILGAGTEQLRVASYEYHLEADDADQHLKLVTIQNETDQIIRRELYHDGMQTVYDNDAIERYRKEKLQDLELQQPSTQQRSFATAILGVGSVSRQGWGATDPDPNSLTTAGERSFGDSRASGYVGPNAWAYELQLKEPGLADAVVFVNAAGLEMLKQRRSGGAVESSYTLYDRSQRLRMTADSRSVGSYTSSLPSLVGSATETAGPPLLREQGVRTWYTYYSEQDSGPGVAVGHLRSVSQTIGHSTAVADRIPVSRYEYFGRSSTVVGTDATATIFLPSAETRYPTSSFDVIYTSSYGSFIGFQPSAVTTNHAGAYQTTAEYNLHGELIREIDGAGRERQYQSWRVNGAFDEAVVVLDGGQSLIERTYRDQLGRVTETRTPALVAAGKVGRLVTERVETSQYVETRTTDNRLEDGSPRVSIVRRDSWAGKVDRLAGIQTSSGLKILQASSERFDLGGRTLSVRQFPSTVGLTYSEEWGLVGGGSAIEETTKFGDGGRVQSTTDGIGMTRSFAYDQLGRLLTTTLNGATYEYRRYTADSLLSAVFTEPGPGQARRAEYFYYDALGRAVATRRDSALTFSELRLDGQSTGEYVLDARDAAFDSDAARNSVEFAVLPFSTTSIRALRTAEYDVLGRPTADVVHEVSLQYGSSGPAMSQILSGTVTGATLRTETQYDGSSNAVWVTQPGMIRTIREFDGAGRLTTESVGRAATGDDSIGQMWQSVTTQYDASSNSIFAISREYDEAGAHRARYVANWFDALDRPITSTDFGTNGGSSMTERPAWATRSTADYGGSDPYLRTDYEYGFITGPSSTWEYTQVQDPAGVRDRTETDALGRVTKEIRNFDSSSGVTPDRNVTSEFEYDALSRQTTIRRLLQQAEPEVPGVTPAIPEITRTTTTVYTDRSSGVDKKILHAAPPEHVIQAHQDIYEFNRLGEMIGHNDRNGGKHFYTYDNAGRLITDRVDTAKSTQIDNHIQSRQTAYDVLGRPTLFSALGLQAGGSPVINQSLRQYDGWGNVRAEYQSHSGPVSFSETKAVRYQYELVGNTLRLASMAYPATNAEFGAGTGVRRLHYRYADGSNRVTAVSDAAGNPATDVERYTYLGASTVAKVSRPLSGSGSQLLEAIRTAVNGTTTDRFGRLQQVTWTTPNETVFDVRLWRDPVGRLLTVEDNVTPGFSQIRHISGSSTSAAYDGIGRIKGFSRGLLTGGTQGVEASSGRPNVVAPAALSHWDVDSQLIHRRVMEWPDDEQQRPIFQGSTLDENAVRQRVKSLTPSPMSALTVLFDAWGNLTRTTDWGVTGSTVEKLIDQYFGHDALGRRISELRSWHNLHPTAGNIHSKLYYDLGGNVIQEDHSANGLIRYVYSPTTGQLVLRDRDTDNNSMTHGVSTAPAGVDERLYAIHDGEGNVTAVLNFDGSVIERYFYTPEGKLTVRDSGGYPVSGWNNSLGWEAFFQSGRWDGQSRYHIAGQSWDFLTGGPLSHDPYSYWNEQLRYKPPALHWFDQAVVDTVGVVRPGLDWIGIVDPTGVARSLSSTLDMAMRNTLLLGSEAGDVLQGFPTRDADPSMSWSDVGHLTLDVLGMVPVVGSVFDGANAVWYLAEGRYTEAAMSAAAAVPLIGDAAAAGKLGASMKKLANVVENGKQFVATGVHSVPALKRVAMAGGSAGGHPLGSRILSAGAMGLVGGIGVGAVGGVAGYLEGGWDGAHQGFWGGLMLGGMQGAARGAINPFICFVAGTKVVVGVAEEPAESADLLHVNREAGGSTATATRVRYQTVAIETLVARGGGEMGDGRTSDGAAQLVLTRDQHDPTGPLVRRRITRTYQRTAYALQVLTLRDEGGNEQTLRVTEEHPFYVVAAGWTPAKSLAAGETILGAEGGLTVVSNELESHAEGVAVYNLEVAEAHTYFVLVENASGTGAVWVHNANYEIVRDPMPRKYAKGWQGAVVGDHRLSRAIGRVLGINADKSENVALKAFATNARKGGLERQWIKDFVYYRRSLRGSAGSAAAARAQAFEVMRPELVMLVRDAVPLVRPNTVLDMIPSPGGRF